MSGSGSGNGSGGGRIPDSEGLVRIKRGPAKVVMGTPEQGCQGCVIGAAALLLAALFWVWFFWRQIQADSHPQPAPPARLQQAR